MVKKIIIAVGETELELSVKDAKRLLADLQSVFGTPAVHICTRPHYSEPIRLPYTYFESLPKPTPRMPYIYMKSPSEGESYNSKSYSLESKLLGNQTLNWQLTDTVARKT